MKNVQIDPEDDDMDLNDSEDRDEGIDLENTRQTGSLEDDGFMDEPSGLRDLPDED